MRLIDFILEAPLGDIETFGDFGQHPETDMKIDPAMSTLSIDNPSRKLLTGDLKKYRDAFSKTPFTFNFYFYSRVGSIDVKSQIRKEITKSIDLKDPDDINIIMTNNVTTSDDYMPMTPWILAHRIAHVFMLPVLNRIGKHSGNEIDDINDYMITHLMGITDLYNPGPRKMKGKFYHDRTIYKKWLDQLWPHIGTMRTARRGRPLATELDFGAELMAQYLITGAVTFNKTLPDRLDSPDWPHDDPILVATTKQVNKHLSTLEKTFNDYFLKLFTKYQGHTAEF